MHSAASIPTSISSTPGISLSERTSHLAHIVSIQVGRVQPRGPTRVPTSFVKRSVDGPIAITLAGVTGDEQADHSVHGDAAKAVYGYTSGAYDIWRESHPQHRTLLEPGGMAENLTIAGVTEEEVCIGDIVQAGSAILQVTQPREPCFKFALRFNDPLMPKAMIRNGRSGWYYRVLQAGSINANDPVTLTDRLNPDWPITRMNGFIHAKRRTRSDVTALANLPGLAETWIPRLRKLAG